MEKINNSIVSTAWGKADSSIKNQVKQEILNNTKNWSHEDQALALAIAQFESGLNPNAKAKTTSASGVFQLVKKTAEALGVKGKEVFDIKKNVKAGIALMKENFRFIPKSIKGDSRAVYAYALHHDGPSLSYGGMELAKEKFLPLYKRVKNGLYDFN